jgi:AcrR family transcriptional regulator
MAEPVSAGEKSGKPAPRWQRDPDGMRRRIIEAAMQEFARAGFGGARMDRIAAAADADKRMLYYHVGNKEALYLAVLEEAYVRIRRAERELNLDALAPVEAIERLISFTWRYFLKNPEFISLLNDENLYKGRHLRKSDKVQSMHSPFVEMIAAVLRRGEAEGVFRSGIDPIQLYISIAGIAYFYVSNKSTLGIIFDRDLMAKEARASRLAHMTDLIVSALRKSP